LSQADLARDAGEQRAERHSHHAHDAARRDLAAKTSLSPAPAADSDAELARRVDDDLGGLGCLSLGRPNAGALLNGKPFPEGDNWEVLDPTRAFATQETIDYLKTAIASVAASHGVVHKLIIGHLSREHGGPIRPHRSHQSGRDVDLSYYYRPEKAEWYRPATEGTLDLDRSWAFVRALVTETDVEMILIDIRVQRLLKEHALSLGEDREWLDSVFQFRGRGGEPIIRHAFGHRTHIHVRFYNPRAQDLGHRVFDQLTKRDIIKPRHYTVRYRARPGDNLDVLAAKAGTSVTTIGRMNGIKRGEMRAGQTYLVPMRGRVARVTNVAIPPRRLPPLESGIRSRGVAAAADAPL
jgi:penicillin-insensitive murein endopeptidase